MRRIDHREGFPEAPLAGANPPHMASNRDANLMIDAIIEELAGQNIDLESITLEEMKRLFTDACRE